MANKGTFKKGHKKVGGRKRGGTKATADIKAAAQAYGLRAIELLAEMMDNEDCFEPTRVAAAKELLDRGYGKSVQPTDVNVNKKVQYEVILDFGTPQVLVPSEAAQPARIPGPARNGKALGHNGSS